MKFLFSILVLQMAVSSAHAKFSCTVTESDKNSSLTLLPPSEQETTLELKGVKLFLLKSTIDKMKGSEIDYLEGLQGAGFKVNNPNEKKSCGCGSTVGF